MSRSRWQLFSFVQLSTNSISLHKMKAIHFESVMTLEVELIMLRAFHGSRINNGFDLNKNLNKTQPYKCARKIRKQRYLPRVRMCTTDKHWHTLLTLFYINSLSIFVFTSFFFYYFLSVFLHPTMTLCRQCLRLIFHCVSSYR